MSPPLHPVWRDYRNRQRAALLAVGGLAAARLLGVMLDPWAGVALLAASASSTACVAAAVWFASFRCPFCGKHFHWTWLVGNPFSARCLHCGFEKLRDPEAARAYVPRAR